MDLSNGGNNDACPTHDSSLVHAAVNLLDNESLRTKIASHFFSTGVRKRLGARYLLDQL